MMTRPPRDPGPTRLGVRRAAAGGPRSSGSCRRSPCPVGRDLHHYAHDRQPTHPDRVDVEVEEDPRLANPPLEWLTSLVTTHQSSLRRPAGDGHGAHS
jgi:hypothetical protein